MKELLSTSFKTIKLPNGPLTIESRFYADGKLFFFKISHVYKPTAQVGYYYADSKSCSSLNQAKQNLKAYIAGFTDDYIENEYFNK